MVLLFGNKNYGEHLGYIVTMCSKCRVDRIFSIDQRRQKLTVYFIPTFQYRVKQYMTCQACGESFEIADSLKDDVARRLMTKEQLVKTIGEMDAAQAGLLPICQNCRQPVEANMRYCPACGNCLS